MNATTPSDVSVDPHARPGGWRNSPGLLFGMLLFFATLSLVASWVLSYDALLLAGDPSIALSCDVNSVISCTTVADSWQAKLFGFPNSFIGLATEPVLMTIAVLGLARTKLPRWFMFAANLFSLFGALFAYWLLYSSMFVIGALCPWCLVVMFSTTFVLAVITHWNILEDNLYLPPKMQSRAMSLVRSGSYSLLAALWLVMLVAVIVLKYGPKLVGG